MRRRRVESVARRKLIVLTSLGVAVLLTLVLTFSSALPTPSQATLKHEEVARLTVALFEAFERSSAEESRAASGLGGGGTAALGRPWTETTFNFGGEMGNGGGSMAIDVGRMFGERANGMRYGWSVDHTRFASTRHVDVGSVGDSLIHTHPVLSQWDLEVPSGTYEVEIMVGDPKYAGKQQLRVQGVDVWSGERTCCRSKGAGCDCVGESYLTKTISVTVATGTTLRLDAGPVSASPQSSKGSAAGRLVKVRVKQTAAAESAVGEVSPEESASAEGGIEVLL